MGMNKENARTILEENPWTAGVWALQIHENGDMNPTKPEDPDANCFCTVGAIDRSIWEMGIWQPEAQEDEKEEQLRAITTAIIEDEDEKEFVSSYLGDDFEEYSTEELLDSMTKIGYRINKLGMRLDQTQLLWFVSDWSDNQNEQEDIMRMLEKAFPKDAERETA